MFYLTGHFSGITFEKLVGRILPKANITQLNVSHTVYAKAEENTQICMVKLKKASNIINPNAMCKFYLFFSSKLQTKHGNVMVPLLCHTDDDFNSVNNSVFILLVVFQVIRILNFPYLIQNMY